MAPRPVINYLARDYQSFRQLMLDRLASTLPAWSERHAADLGVAIVEVLAYAADRLSYQQDATATEAYIGTARRRISLRRHGRLIDYALHEGCNARTWVHVTVERRSVVIELEKASFLAAKGLSGSAGPVVNDAGADELRKAGAVEFLPMTRKTRALYENRNRMEIVSRLETGATGADLSTTPGPGLEAGTVLILLSTADQGEAEKTSCHPVMLVGAGQQRPNGNWHIAWHEDDALPEAMTKGSKFCALGNNILVDHGGWIERDTIGNGSRHALPDSIGLTHAAPLESPSSAASAVRQDSVDARPAIDVKGWKARPDLLSSWPLERHYCLEFDDTGRGFLQFGDGNCGALPDEDSFVVTFRSGNGPAGNIPRNAITHLVGNDTGIVSVSNPLEGMGGLERESTRLMSIIAPGSIAIDQPRAIVAADYERFANAMSGVQKSAATIYAEGARRVAAVAIDPSGFDASSVNRNNRLAWAVLKQRVEARLEGVRCLNHDVVVVPPRYVDLDIRLRLDAAMGYEATDIERSVLSQLGEHFGIDNQSFGQTVRWSPLAALILRLPGVASLAQVRFGRKDRPTRRGADELVGTIEIGPLEVPRFTAGPEVFDGRG